jgi:chromosomal replication initiation ATPase DnaA
VRGTDGDPIWSKALELIAEQVNEGTFLIWFQPTAGLGFTDGVYHIGVASDFAKDWIGARFQSLVSDAVSQVVGDTVPCEIIVSPELSRTLRQEDVNQAANAQRERGCDRR